MTEALYFRQFLAGRDFATSNPTAVAMRNFSYVIGDRVSKTALLVDPAYDVDELVALVSADGLEVIGAIATHYHPDHIGGRFLDQFLEGVAELHERYGALIHAHADEVEWIAHVSDLDATALVTHADGDQVTLGDVIVTLHHTPGHTPGSQCLLVDGRLLSGDTLFLEGCGRVDLPGSDPTAMAETLASRFRAFGDDVVLYPGHLYSAESSLAMGEVRRRNEGLLESDQPATW